MLRYVDNPNGSVDDIAGVCNAGATWWGSCPTPSEHPTALLGLDGRCSAAVRPAGRGREPRAAAPATVTW